MALVTVLQKAANLTDRQAADEVRENLAWKYALGLTLDDPGFDHSVLSEFRTRVVEHQLEERVLDLLLKRRVSRSNGSPSGEPLRQVFGLLRGEQPEQDHRHPGRELLRLQPAGCQKQDQQPPGNPDQLAPP